MAHNKNNDNTSNIEDIVREYEEIRAKRLESIRDTPIGQEYATLKKDDEERKAQEELAIQEEQKLLEESREKREALKVFLASSDGQEYLRLKRKKKKEYLLHFIISNSLFCVPTVLAVWFLYSLNILFYWWGGIVAGIIGLILAGIIYGIMTIMDYFYSRPDKCNLLPIGIPVLSIGGLYVIDSSISIFGTILFIISAIIGVLISIYNNL